MKVISSNKSFNVYRPDTPPVIRIFPGDEICVETADSFAGVTDATELARRIASFSEGEYQIGHITGPIYVDGAMPGDTLVVEIGEIQVAEKGVMALLPQYGILPEYLPNPYTRVVYIRDGFIEMGSDLSIPLCPSIGKIGTTPKKEIISGLPGPHGGNMDIQDITTGSKVFLPVFVPGGLLALGDVHAAIGDGEISFSGIEIAAKVKISVEVIHNEHRSQPWIETNEAYISVASDERLEEAIRTASVQMLEFLMHKKRLSPSEAYSLLGAVAHVRLGQIVTPIPTVRILLPRKIFKSVS